MSEFALLKLENDIVISMNADVGQAVKMLGENPRITIPTLQSTLNDFKSHVQTLENLIKERQDTAENICICTG